jgi:hypothetical protein
MPTAAKALVYMLELNLQETVKVVSETRPCLSLRKNMYYYPQYEVLVS